MILKIIGVGMAAYYLTQATISYPLLAWIMVPFAFLPLLVES